MRSDAAAAPLPAVRPRGARTGPPVLAARAGAAPGGAGEGRWWPGRFPPPRAAPPVPGHRSPAAPGLPPQCPALQHRTGPAPPAPSGYRDSWRGFPPSDRAPGHPGGAAPLPLPHHRQAGPSGGLPILRPGTGTPGDAAPFSFPAPVTGTPRGAALLPSTPTGHQDPRGGFPPSNRAPGSPRGLLRSPCPTAEPRLPFPRPTGGSFPRRGAHTPGLPGQGSGASPRTRGSAPARGGEDHSSPGSWGALGHIPLGCPQGRGDKTGGLRGAPACTAPSRAISSVSRCASAAINNSRDPARLP